MPVYLCLAGTETDEPWKCGIQVYSKPFAVPEPPLSPSPCSCAAAAANNNDQNNDQSVFGDTTTTIATTNVPHPPLPDRSVGTSEPIHVPLAELTTSTAIRKVLHAQVVLVDDVCVAYGRYWVRLRWPGRKGGFAGYIAMHKVKDDDDDAAERDANLPPQPPVYSSTGDDDEEDDRETSDDDDDDDDVSESNPMIQPLESDAGDDASMMEEEDGDNNNNNRDPQQPPSSGGSGSIMDQFRRLVCQRTNLQFPTSGVFSLLHVYDDGVRGEAALPPFPTEQVFCRICREGLHDDAEELPAAAKDDVAETAVTAAGTSRRSTSATNNKSKNFGRHRSDDNEDDDDMDDDDGDDDGAMDPQQCRLVRINDQGPVRPHPVYTAHTEVMENPMLAPCQCSGSMKFVHYMCIEQWRCRSRHPTAANGMNCETCGAKYALPPPTQYQHPAQVAVDEPADWQDAMPPHVMNALRQPHVWWQIGAAIVRRRWLRPAAPIVMSPIVALYCRARRLLKKRGVARRRWACSLCRRRARWKCVRCLRSYYCSRQCQNVAWHIIHKHVCYKPSRFYGSVAFYGLAALLAMPGILRDPLFYDLGFLLIPASFIVVSVIVGGLATLMKKVGGVDTRGRRLELAVVLITAWLSTVSLGLLCGFFHAVPWTGMSQPCFGVAGRYLVTRQNLSSTVLLQFIHTYLLRPGAYLCQSFDVALAARVPKWTRLCVVASSRQPLDDKLRCFAHLGHAEADFFLVDEKRGGGQGEHQETCAADLLLVGLLYGAAVLAYVGNGVHKHFERRQRRRQRGGHLHAD